MLGNWDVGGKAELFRSMGAVPVQFKDGRIFGFHALLEAGKGKPSLYIESTTRICPAKGVRRKCG